MGECEKVDLLKLQGKYLIFIIENHVELNILEHLEKCNICRKNTIKAIQKNQKMPTYGSLFDSNSEDYTMPQLSEYENPENFMDSRIKWRKRKLNELIKNAEIELADLETRI
jgi:hypothetical protein